MVKYDCIVIGGGHAGCESALATSKMGLNTLLLTLNLETIGQLSCNPSMGGLGKSQLIYEVDALGGAIGWLTDLTGIGFRMLNTRKGPAVQSLRAQVDRRKYRESMQKVILNTKNLSVKQEEVTEIIVKNKKAIGVRTNSVLSGVTSQQQYLGQEETPDPTRAQDSGMEYLGKTIIITTGTFLNGLIHIGLQHFPSGRMGELPSIKLSTSLRKLGFQLGRLKTGTSPRIDGRTIDFSKTIPQEPDINPAHFSYHTENFNPPRVNCYITHTNSKTHNIILKNLDSSPLYQGIITGTGVRYCPSIEDKCVKFKEISSHQVFIEPDGIDSTGSEVAPLAPDNEYYLNGTSTSLPEDVQVEFLHTIPGLEKAKIIRPGYGIEYDFIFPEQTYPTLESKSIKNLWFAGQILGTSGYEEASAQGIIAGINAGLRVKKSEPFIPARYEAYIGVLIDDLTTKEIREPYRMFTSRVEHRLILRQDNAPERLMKYGVQFGLVDKNDFQKIEELEEIAESKLEYIKKKRLAPTQINPILSAVKSTQVTQPVSIFQLLKRPQINWKTIEPVIEADSNLASLVSKVIQKLEIFVKYEGYIKREAGIIKKLQEAENYKIPSSFDYSKVKGFSREAQEKLSKFKPVTIAQARRIAGVRTADLIHLLFTLKSKRIED